MNNWTFGYQRGVVDLDGATEYNSDIFGISFSVNDNLTNLARFTLDALI